jgi:hypothetical protein
MQSLAQFQIELVDEAGDGGRRARPHRLLQSPQRFVAMRRLDQDHAARIEPERAKAMTMQPTVVGQPVDRQDEEKFLPPPLWGREGWGVGRRGTPVEVYDSPPDPHPQPLPTRGRGGNTGKNRGDEAQRGRGGLWSGHDLMQGAAGEAAFRQVGIKRGNAEGEGCA